MKKDQPSIENRIRDIIVANLGVNETDITPNASLSDDLGADSLDAVEIVITIEDEFDIAIPDDVAEEIKTVQQLIDCTKKLVGK